MERLLNAGIPYIVNLFMGAGCSKTTEYLPRNIGGGNGSNFTIGHLEKPSYFGCI